MGYFPNGYRVWDPKKKAIVVARDVVFVETEVPGKVVDRMNSEDQFLILLRSTDDMEDRNAEPDDDFQVQNAEPNEDESDEEFGSFLDDSTETNADVEVAPNLEREQNRYRNRCPLTEIGPHETENHRNGIKILNSSMLGLH